MRYLDFCLDNQIKAKCGWANRHSAPYNVNAAIFSLISLFIHHIKSDAKQSFRHHIIKILGQITRLLLFLHPPIGRVLLLLFHPPIGRALGTTRLGLQDLLLLDLSVCVSVLA